MSGQASIYEACEVKSRRRQKLEFGMHDNITLILNKHT